MYSECENNDIIRKNYLITLFNSFHSLDDVNGNDTFPADMQLVKEKLRSWYFR